MIANLAENKKIVAIIPARGGSKGIPKKNIVDLCGKPLISYSIEAAKNSKFIDEVFVSTDCPEISKISEKFGAAIVKRPDEFATDTASSELALLHFAENKDFDIMVFLQCTSPLTTTEDIDNALKKYFQDGYDSVLSVCEDRGGFLCGGFIWDEGGNSINYDYKNRSRRQGIDKKYYRENGAIYITSKKNLLEYKNRLSGKIGLSIMPNIRSYEIDEPSDLENINKVFEILRKKNLKEVSQKKIRGIRLIMFDVDGVFTDGSVYLDKNGDEILKFSRIDGKGVELLRNNGFKTAIITSGDSEIIKKRMEKLQIDEIHLGIKDKVAVYENIKNKYSLVDNEICFCGDDVQDSEVLKRAGFSACPNNAQEEVKNICNFVSQKNGGQNFVREICNFIINK